MSMVSDFIASGTFAKPNIHKNLKSSNNRGFPPFTEPKWYILFHYENLKYHIEVSFWPNFQGSLIYQYQNR